jgi:hypothetical protein
VNLYPPNTIYIYTLLKWIFKKIKMWHIFCKIWTSKKEKEKKKRGSTIVVVHKGGFSTCLLNK